MLSIFNTRKDFDKTECELAVLPVGAIEQHGSHLPVGTDTILANEFASRIAEQLDAYLLPAIPITSSIEHRKGNGTVYIKADTLALVIRDVAESLHYSGYKKLVIVNFHGGNWILKPTVRNLNRNLEGMQVVLLHADVAMHRHGEIFKHLNNDVHAGEFETSIMLHTHPEKVQAIVPQTNPEFVPQAFMDYFDVTEITQDGYWGFPEEATADKGARVLDIMVQCALEYLQEIEIVTQKVKNRNS
ncbi:MAG: Creatininase [Paenibacillus sp.]|jgi:creatinine amidohydrolase|nr:Creatininase [Paenibacillus sp.]